MSELEELANEIMMLQRASEGKQPVPVDVISNLINVREPLERTGFPTYTILTQAVYLKLGYKLYGEEAKVLDHWSNLLMSALIAYKRQNRKEWVEAVKRSSEPDEGTRFYLGNQTPVKAQKRRFWRRQPKEQSEFVEG